VLKTALLERTGLRVVHVEYWEWDALMLQAAQVRAQWLRTKIERAHRGGEASSTGEIPGDDYQEEVEDEP
jgi:hypothetical protein